MTSLDDCFGITNQHVYDAWLTAITDAFAEAKAIRLKELHGTRQRGFDSRGVHAYSEAVGKVTALEALFPELVYANFDPHVLRDEASADALDEFVATFQVAA